MAALQPMTKDIAEQLNLAQVNGIQDQLFFRRIKREIEKIRGVNISEYYSLLGIYYAVTFDYEQCVQNYDSALHLGVNSRLLRNYAYSLKNFGKGQKALALLLKAFHAEPVPEIFEEVMIAVIHSGNTDPVDEVVAKFSKANPEIDVADRQDVFQVNLLRSLISSASIPSSDLQDVMVIADGVLANHKCINYLIRYEGEHFGDMPYVSVELVVHGQGAEVIIAMNQEVADLVAASDISSWDKVIVRFYPASKIIAS